MTKIKEENEQLNDKPSEKPQEMPLCDDVLPLIDKTANDIWSWAIDHVVAGAIGPNVTLFTRDGSKSGNAIIIKLAGDHPEMGENLAGSMWLLETDYGNRMTLAEFEIKGMYTLGFEQEYSAWFDRRLETIKKTLD